MKSPRDMLRMLVDLTKFAKHLFLSSIVASVIFVLLLLAIAGLEFCGVHACDAVNTTAHGGRAGGLPLILFAKERGLVFPLLIYCLQKRFPDHYRHKDDTHCVFGGSGCEGRCRVDQ